METNYYLIYSSPDGVYIQCHDNMNEVSETLESIQEECGKCGNIVWGTDIENGEVTLIKGKNIVPKEKTKVKVWDDE